MAAPLLQLEDITKHFGAVRALNGVSFGLEAGEVHALLGENGAGKSTLIKVVTGAHAPDGGTIRLDGAEIQRLRPGAAKTRGIACIYQQPALFPDLTVAENISLGLDEASPFRRVRRGDQEKRAKALLNHIGAAIDPMAEVRQLSMPEQQLVEIAKALGSGARIFIFDEPTASLTLKDVGLLLGVIRDLRAHGAGVIYISHRLEEIFQIADRITVLRDGQSVGTLNATDASEASLIRLMVGREVTSIYPPAESPPGTALLSLRNLCCRASGVQGIHLDLRAGEVLGLAGLVGAGRTELCRTLFGITPADTGSIILDGCDLDIRSPRDAIAAGIAYVPEDRRRHGVILEMTIAENISMGILPRLFPGSWLSRRAENDLASQFIRDLAIKTPSPLLPAASLSGGNQQKVALGRWLAAKPRVLLLDEPTQGVDVGAKAEIHRIIRRLAAEGMAVILVSSDLPEILGMSDRIAVMRKGAIVAEFEGKASNARGIMAAALGQAETGAASC